MIQADLHLHTSCSSDASNQPKTIVEQLCEHPTIKAVAITDHNTIDGYQEVKKLASSYQGILIIPGVEIAAVEGELIVLGIARLPPKPWKVENVIRFAKENDGLVIAPHPFRGYGLGSLVKELDVDAIEILNGITPPSQNRQAKDLAKLKGLPGVAGSDAHDNRDLWRVYTEIEASLDVDDVLKAIRKGRVRVSSIGKSIHF